MSSEWEQAISPKQRGYRMPAEWHPHGCTWVAWPCNQETWPEYLQSAQTEFLDLVAAIAIDESVVVVVPNEEQADIFQAMKHRRVSHQLPIDTVQLPTNDAWIRDYGPTFVVRQDHLLAVDWKYNAWGGKYPPFDDDSQLVQRLVASYPVSVSPAQPVEYFRSRLCIEGGAIEVDGKGLAMCTKSCVLDPQRNPDWSLTEIDNEIKECVGVDEVIWLPGDALAGDDTDGHIDQLARFVPGQKIVYAWTDESNDPQHKGLKDNVDHLRQFADSQTSSWELTPLPLPAAIHNQSCRLPTSYCNFYITNASVIVPQFGDPPSDERALQILSELFPERKTIGKSSYYLSCGLGSFHCLTQQQPSSTG